MAPVFDRYGVRVVAISSDSPAAARLHRGRDDLARVELVADPQLEAIGAIGAIHRRGLPFRTASVFGVPLGYPQRPRKMAIPTSILVDEDGIVRWIDQADDYRMRGDRARVEAALAAAFGDAAQGG